MKDCERATFQDFVCLAAISNFPGQFKYASEEGLARMLNTSVDVVKSTIKVCVDRKRITIKKDKEGYLVKISKWNIYQALRPVDDNSGSNDFKVNDNALESISKSKSNLSESSEFSVWWKQYPKKLEKKDAIKAYEHNIKEGATHEEMLTALRNYCIKLSYDKTEEKYIKHPATFLRAERWRDYLSMPTEKPKQVGENRGPTKPQDYWDKIRELKMQGLAGDDLMREMDKWQDEQGGKKNDSGKS